MYGEKVEEADELRLDLQDVKEMYKLQVSNVFKKSLGCTIINLLYNFKGCILFHTLQYVFYCSGYKYIIFCTCKSYEIFY